ncbi:ANTAR domain-containing protein [Nocardioides aquiterrae]
MDAVTSSHADGPAAGDRLSAGVDALERRIAQVRAEREQDVLVQDLETAYEELRTAEEEIRAQTETIERLVRSRDSLRVQQERVLAVLPVPVVLTDAHGVIRTVNAAAALVLNLRVDRLLGKPLFALFAADDRRTLRQLLVRGARGAVARQTATLLPRGASARAVEVVVTSQLGLGGGEVCWVLLAGGGAAESGAGGGVVDALAALALLPQHPGCPRELVERAVRIVGSALPAPAHVSLVTGSPLEPAATASSSQVAQRWDGLQLATGEGPSVTAHGTGLTVSSPDVGKDARWPRLARHVEPGAVAAVAVPVPSADRTVGVLAVYGVPGQPSAPAELVELFAVTVGGVLHELDLVRELDRLEADMRRALASRAVIDQAKGIIMAAHGIDAEAAWEHLLALSSAQHVKVRELAQRIVDRAVGTG